MHTHDKLIILSQLVKLIRKGTFVAAVEATAHVGRRGLTNPANERSECVGVLPEFPENKPTPDFSAFSIQNSNYCNLKLILKILKNEKMQRVDLCSENSSTAGTVVSLLRRTPTEIYRQYYSSRNIFNKQVMKENHLFIRTVLALLFGPLVGQFSLFTDY